jgi:hypothetical protein
MGMNIAFGLNWDVLNLVREFQVQIATDKVFGDVILEAPFAAAPSMFFVPASSTAPGWVVPLNSLLAGQTYYARVRARRADTLQVIRTLYSTDPTVGGAPVVIIVQAGMPVQSQYSGPQALAPSSGASNVGIQGVGFSWTGFPGATEYSFVLATDAALVKTVVSAVTSQPSYSYDGKLTNSTTYFWQVQETKPAPSEKSPVFAFTTAAVPPTPAPTPAPAAPPVINIPPQPVPSTPAWVWVVIAMGGILVVVVIVLIFRTRRA